MDALNFLEPLQSFEESMECQEWATSWEGMVEATGINDAAAVAFYTAKTSFDKGVQAIDAQCRNTLATLVRMHERVSGATAVEIPPELEAVEAWHIRILRIRTRAFAHLVDQTKATMDALDLALLQGTLPRNVEKRKNFDASTRSLLKSWLKAHGNRPTKDQKAHLAAQTGLSVKQVSTYFANARYRARK